MTDPDPVTLPHRPATAGPAPTGPEPAASPGEPPGLAEVTVPGFTIERELGRGGMGVVYQARQDGLQRPVALKMILAAEFAGVEERRRFRAEAAALARVQHSGIVQVHAFGEHAGQPYFALEYVPGGTLAQRLGGTPQDPRWAARVVAQLARAVQAAHAAGIVHRDLKPANVLFTADGTPKVTDFGLAKHLPADPALAATAAPGAALTASGVVMGTPGYMAPEQASGQAHRAGPAADVYALGAILYECLTGRPPFAAPTPMETVLLVLLADPAAPRLLQPKLPRDLETICLKCLEKEPARRYPTAAALAEDLEAWLAGDPIRARPPGLGRLVGAWLRQNFGAAGWAVPVGLAYGLVATLLFWMACLAFQLYRWGQVYPRAFPSLPLPPLVPAAPTTIPFYVVVYVGVTLAGCTAGLVTAGLIRPRNRMADVAVGLVTGGISAVTLFALSAGWWFVFYEAERPVIRDLYLLSRTAWVAEGTPPAGTPPAPAAGAAALTAAEAARELLAKYPDLGAVPPAERGACLEEKILIDVLARIPFGLAWGLAYAVGLCGTFTLTSSLLGGREWRRCGGVRAALLPYLEVAVPLAFLVVGVFAGILDAYRGGPVPLALHFQQLALAVAVPLLWSGRRGLTRVALHLLWLAPCVAYQVVRLHL